MTDQSGELEGNQLSFQHYFVAFLDILGQRDALRKITDLPADESERNDFIKKLKDTFGKVDVLRQGFRQYFDAATSYTSSAGLVPVEHQKEFSACRKSEVYFYGFSDSFIIVVPLAGDDEHCTAMNGVYSALIAASGISLMALSAGTAMRGGLDVGIAAQIEGKEIYGPALERAHFLESSLAEYPRLVIGDELLGYIRRVEMQDPKRRSGAVAKSVARLCREMMIQDADGRPMLDFMGKGAREVFGKVLDPGMVNRARDFVTSQGKKYSDEKNHKLASRYFRLRRYCQSRAELWDTQ